MALAHQIDLFAQQDRVGEADVLGLWTGEAALSEPEARRRLSEVLLVATDDEGSLAAVSTAFVARNDQLRTDMWHFRGYVADAHRMSDVGWRLLTTGMDVLAERFVSGRDVRAPGFLVEVEHPGLRKAFTDPAGPRTGLVFIGENARGHHVRVKWFPGARVPGAAEPPAPPSPGEWTVETLRGRLDDGWSDRLVRFWTANGALDEPQARARLPQVTAAALDPSGEIAGTSSAFASEVPLLGGRRLWVFRSFVLDAAAGAGPALVAATFDTLEAEFEPGLGAPIGLCVPLSADEAARRPEAVWERPRTVYAGYLADGRQVRVGYFAGASI